MKKRIMSSVSWLLLGMSLGFIFTKHFYGQMLLEFIDNFRDEAVTQASMDHAYASMLRQRKYDQLIGFYESGMQTHALTFIDDEGAFDKLSESDYCVLYKLKEYWKEDCQRQCFEDLSPILMDHEIRIDSSCKVLSQRQIE